jgi:hypothetical protein
MLIMKKTYHVYINPLNWNALTWTLFVLWLLFAILENTPIEPEFAIDSPRHSQVQSSSVFFGWPFWHTEFFHSYQTGSSTRSTNMFIVVLDFLIIVFVQAAIVVLVQGWLARFTLRTMFVLTTLAAVVFLLERFAFSSNSLYLHFGYMYFVYFSPVWGLICAVLVTKMRSNNTVVAQSP